MGVWLALLSTVGLNAQTTEPAWEQRIGAAFHDDGRDLIRNQTGGLTLVGETNPEGLSGKDILLVVFDERNRPVLERPLIFSENDGAYAVTTARDGGYYIVGYTYSPEIDNYHGRRDGLLLKVTETGRPLWYRALGTARDDALYDVLEDEDGNVIVTGYRNEGLVVAKYTALGEELWERAYAVGEQARGHALCRGEDGSLLAAGYVPLPGRRFELVLLSISANGNIAWEERYPDAVAEDIIPTTDGGYLIAGVDLADERQADNVLLLKVSARGSEIWRRSYGGGGSDGALSVYPYAGGYLAAGHNASFETAARRTLGWARAFDAEGLPTGPARLYGGKQEDRFAGVVEGFDGRFYAAGTTASGKLLFRDTWLVAVTDSLPPDPTGARAELQPDRFWDANENGVLEANERSYHRVRVYNRGPKDLTRVALRVYAGEQEKYAGVTHFPVLRTARIPAGGSAVFHLPFVGAPSVYNATNQYALELTANGSETILDQVLLPVLTQRAPEPRFAVSSPVFSVNGSPVGNTALGELFTLQFDLTNTGSRTADGVMIRLNTERFVIIEAERGRQWLDSLAPGQTATIRCQFLAERVYSGETIVIKNAVSDGAGKHELQTEFLLPVGPGAAEAALAEVPLPEPLDAIAGDEPTPPVPDEPVFTPVVPPVRTDAPTAPVLLPVPGAEPPEYVPAPRPEPVERVDTVFVPVVPAFVPQVRLVWLEPDPYEYTDRTIPILQREFAFKLRAIANVELKAEQFTVLLNGRPLPPNVKFDEVKLSPTPPIADRPDQRYTYKSRLQLDYGIHTLTVVVDHGGKRFAAEPITLSFPLRKPNLFVLAIGIPHPDLRFTKDDAKDFAAMYAKHQDGPDKLFGAVNIKLLNTPENTTKAAIEQEIYSMSLRADKGEIRENDLVLVLISSHGFKSDYGENGRENFYIKTIDYTPERHIPSSINYEEEIMQRLERIKAAKVVLVDACFSGAAAYYTGRKGGTNGGPGDKLTEAIIRINDDAKDIRSIVSCNRDEASYEHPKWVNGAFTEALIDALTNRAEQTLEGIKRANSNGDKFLTISELCRFLKLRVPHLVTEQYPPPASQNPYVNTRYLTDELPIFQYKD